MRPEREKGIRYVPRMAPATLTPPRERARRGTGSGIGRAWRVIVLNDDHNTFQGVAYALSNVLPGVSYEQGMSARDAASTRRVRRSSGRARRRLQSSTGRS